MEVIPAIDLRDGRCVRLYQGDYTRERVFSEDPVRVAQQWQEQGAPRLHVVDLDAARLGRPGNLDTVARIASTVTIPIQVGGGIRDAKTAAQVLGLGVQRIVVGSVAVEKPQVVSRMLEVYGAARLVVALDARDGLVAVRGWKERASVSPVELALKMKELGVQRILYTDIGRDGTLSGPDLRTTAELVTKTGLAVLASGGISTVDHLRALAEVGAEGAVVGMALYTGVLTLGQALSSLRS
ncbi:MAG: 1-(5-phosphoribosyl)-5-[(5-phosphoribosylamino)methylideneamino]imidazole-4-carboxamide isomerase [Chloroflexi bacterium]|nr:1-(5-phosphoribosyl)-5-[(5-phosphoribosylamino)methylideneamino]imidazole-4-carboxamide isomerase [Chloroflexota bacterium]